MSVDERSRHELYLKLESSLGAEAATTMMEMLPSVGWADVATKRDLDQLAVATKRDLDQLEQRLTASLTASFRGELVAQTRTMIFALISAIFTMTGVVTGVVFAAR